MIEQIAIRNYKSLRDICIKMGPLSVLIGPNESGKSNLLDVFAFLRDFVVKGEEALSKRGGFETLVWAGNASQNICFNTKGSLQIHGKSHSFEYGLELAGTRYGSASIAKEVFSLYHGGEFRKLLELAAGDSTAYMYDLEGKKLGGFGSGRVQSSLANVQPWGQSEFIAAFATEVRQWEVYDPVPALMRMKMPAKKELKLSAQGENLATVLHTLHSEFPEDFKKIEDYLRMLVPENRQLLSFLTEEGQTYPGMLLEAIPFKIPAMSFSDGTLRLLAFLTIVYSPDSTPLVCFEEPENYIHPHGLELIVDLLKQASTRRQVLATTHSPHVLNFVPADRVFVLEKDNGATKINPASSKKHLKSLLKQVGLGEAWYAGSLGGVPRRPS